MSDTLISCHSHAPYWGPSLQPRHVPWLEIEPATFGFAGWHLIHWATPARAIDESFYIKFIGMSLVNKIIQVSGVHFYDTWSVYCFMCTPPKVKSSSIIIIYFGPLYTLLPPCTFSSGNHHTVVYVYEFLFCLFFLFVHVLTSVLYLTYEWNYMVLNFFCLTYFTKHDILSVYL